MGEVIALSEREGGDPKLINRAVRKGLHTIDTDWVAFLHCKLRCAVLLPATANQVETKDALKASQAAKQPIPALLQHTHVLIDNVQVR